MRSCNPLLFSSPLGHTLQGTLPPTPSVEAAAPSWCSVGGAAYSPLPSFPVLSFDEPAARRVAAVKPPHPAPIALGIAASPVSSPGSTAGVRGSAGPARLYRWQLRLLVVRVGSECHRDVDRLVSGRNRRRSSRERISAPACSNLTDMAKRSESSAATDW